jgi:hypothetical protein
MFDKIFLDHPADVGESYGEHLREASGFGFAMVVGGLACMIHAAIPALFKSTGSGTVSRLHASMVRKRGAKRDAATEARYGGWVI